MAEEDAGIKMVAKGAVIVFFGVFFSKAATYVYRLIMARFLGPEAYGLFSLAFSVFLLSLLFTLVGLPTGINRFVSKYLGKGDEARIRGTIWSAYEIMFPLSLLVAVLLYVSAPLIATELLHEPAVTPLLKAFAVAVPFRTVLKDTVEVFKAFKRMDYFAAVEHVFQSIVLLVAAILLIQAGFGVFGAVAAYVVSMVLAAAVAFLLLQTKVFPVIGGPVQRNRQELALFSLPLFATGAIGTINGNVDNLMMGYFANTVAADVGIYNAALPTGHLISALGMSFGLILFPVITEHLARGEKSAAVNITTATLRWVVAFAFPATLLMVLFSGPILRVLFGPEYVTGRFVLSIIAAAAFLSVATTPVTKFLPAMDKTPWMLANSIIAAAINIPLNVVLIPMYGIVGAGIATTFAIAFSSVLGALEAVYLLNVRPRLDGIHVPVLASGTAAATIYVLLHAVFPIIPGWALIPGGILFTLLYATLFLLMGGLQREDVVVLKAIERRSGQDLEPVKRIIRRLSRA